MAYTTINKHTDFFNTKLYTGTAASNAITGVGFQPDWVWLKSRSYSDNHSVFDSVRGVTKRLFPNLNSAEGTEAQSLKTFDSDGFTLGTDGIANGGSGKTYASWNWKAGTTSGITTNGSTTITPTGYSFNTTSGFSIIKYTGNGYANAKFPHGLGVAPKVTIIKNITQSSNSWYVHHASLGSNTELYLDTSDEAPATTGNDVTPDATNIQLSGTSSATNGSGTPYIAYCFAEKTGYSKFGSYVGNGNADGIFAYTGFKPSWVLIKNSSSAASWTLYDNKRPGYNEDNAYLITDGSDGEATDKDIDLISNGFKPRTSNSALNTSGNTYVYLAFGQSVVGSNNVPATAR